MKPSNKYGILWVLFWALLSLVQQGSSAQDHHGAKSLRARRHLTDDETTELQVLGYLEFTLDQGLTAALPSDAELDGVTPQTDAFYVWTLQREFADFMDLTIDVTAYAVNAERNTVSIDLTLTTTFLGDQRTAQDVLRALESADYARYVIFYVNFAGPTGETQFVHADTATFSGAASATRQIDVPAAAGPTTAAPTKEPSTETLAPTTCVCQSLKGSGMVSYVLNTLGAAVFPPQQTEVNEVARILFQAWTTLIEQAYLGVVSIDFELDEDRTGLDQKENGVTVITIGFVGLFDFEECAPLGIDLSNALETADFDVMYTDFDPTDPLNPFSYWQGSIFYDAGVGCVTLTPSPTTVDQTTALNTIAFDVLTSEPSAKPSVSQSPTFSKTPSQAPSVSNAPSPKTAAPSVGPSSSAPTGPIVYTYQAQIEYHVNTQDFILLCPVPPEIDENTRISRLFYQNVLSVAFPTVFASLEFQIVFPFLECDPTFTRFYPFRIYYEIRFTLRPTTSIPTPEEAFQVMVNAPSSSYVRYSQLQYIDTIFNPFVAVEEIRFGRATAFIPTAPPQSAAPTPVPTPVPTAPPTTLAPVTPTTPAPVTPTTPAPVTTLAPTTTTPVPSSAPSSRAPTGDIVYFYNAQIEYRFDPEAILFTPSFSEDLEQARIARMYFSRYLSAFMPTSFAAIEWTFVTFFLDSTATRFYPLRVWYDIKLTLRPTTSFPTDTEVFDYMKAVNSARFVEFVKDTSDFSIVGEELSTYNKIIEIKFGEATAFVPTAPPQSAPPTPVPTPLPTSKPSSAPSTSQAPSKTPTGAPSKVPTGAPSEGPSKAPTFAVGWYIADTAGGSETCTTTCTNKGGLGCRTTPMTNVDTASEVTFVVANLQNAATGLSCSTTSGSAVNTAPRLTGNSGAVDCFFATGAADCSVTSTNFRLCCCGAADSDCPIA